MTKTEAISKIKEFDLAKIIMDDISNNIRNISSKISKQKLETKISGLSISDDIKKDILIIVSNIDEIVEITPTPMQINTVNIVKEPQIIEKQKSIKPQTFKVGDVFMHKIFHHPYVLLKKRKGHWICGLLTSDEKCDVILEKCESRFFNDNYFTIVLFSVIIPTGKFMCVYDNKKHLKTIYNNLSNLLKKT